MGDGISHPRAVTEAVHLYNMNKKMKEKRTGIPTSIRIRSFDLKEFFTNVPREKFVEALRLGMQMAKAMDPRMRYF
jgi:hypothetical protein